MRALDQDGLAPSAGQGSRQRSPGLSRSDDDGIDLFRSSHGYTCELGASADMEGTLGPAEVPESVSGWGRSRSRADVGLRRRPGGSREENEAGTERTEPPEFVRRSGWPRGGQVLESSHATDTLPAEDSRWTAVLEPGRGLGRALRLCGGLDAIYCRPSCPSRRPRRNQVRFFSSPAAAETEGSGPVAGASRGRASPTPAAGPRGEYLDRAPRRDRDARAAGAAVGLSPSTCSALSQADRHVARPTRTSGGWSG